MSKFIDLNETAYMVHRTAVDKGFWDSEFGPEQVVAKLALVHSEVSEILEAYRKGHSGVDITFEFADVLIRLLDLYQGMIDNEVLSPNFRLTDALNEKMAQNRERPVKHGNLI